MSSLSPVLHRRWLLVALRDPTALDRYFHQFCPRARLKYIRKRHLSYKEIHTADDVPFPPSIERNNSVCALGHWAIHGGSGHKCRRPANDQIYFAGRLSSFPSVC